MTEATFDALDDADAVSEKHLQFCMLEEICKEPQKGRCVAQSKFNNFDRCATPAV
jgi:hypothetical protein